MSNIVIIGSGPAGVSAALYAARAGVQTTVLTKGPGALGRAGHGPGLAYCLKPFQKAAVAAKAVAQPQPGHGIQLCKCLKDKQMRKPGQVRYDGI